MQQKVSSWIKYFILVALLPDGCGRSAVAKVYVMEDGREHFASASMSGQDRMPQIKAMLHANPDKGANCIGSASQGQ